jgi:hypothetical protein
MDGMITHTLAVTYEITRKGYKGGTDKVAITEGYTTVQDIPKMIAIRRSVRPTEVFIKLIREL